MTPPPVVFLFTGFVLTLFGGALTVIGFSGGTTYGIVYTGWVLGGIGGLALFVGLVSWSVEIGVRAADRP